MVEIITSPDRNTGWLAEQENVPEPIASGLCWQTWQKFPGYYVTKFWDATGTCSCPPDDGKRAADKSVTISISSRACYPSAVEGSHVTFHAVLKNYSSTQ